MRWPQEASGSAQSLVPRGGGREKDSRSVQSTASDVLASLNWSGMLASSRSSQTACSGPGGQPVGCVLAEGRGDQAEGALGLPVGEQVRAVFPVRDHAQPYLVVLGQAGQRLVHPGEVGGPVIGLGQAHAGQQGADAQLPGAHAGGQHGLDPRRGAGSLFNLLCERVQVIPV